MALPRAIVRRVLPRVAALVRLFIVTVGATFAVHRLVTAAPGAAGGCGDPAAPLRFVDWLASALRGDLGEPCFGPSITVAGLLGPALLRTLIQVGAAVSLMVVLALPVAVLALFRSGRIGSGVLTTGSALTAIPGFVLAYWLATALNLSVADCRSGAGSCPAWFPLQSHDSSLSLAVAVFVLAVGGGAVVELGRDLAAEVERIRSLDWVVFARSTGRSLWSTVGRTLAAPVAAMILSRAASVVAGVVVVESVLGVRGLGMVTWEAARFRDLPVLLAATAAWALVLGGLRLLAREMEPD